VIPTEVSIVHRDRALINANLIIHGWQPVWDAGWVGIENGRMGISVSVVSGHTDWFNAHPSTVEYNCTEWDQLSDYTMAKILSYMKAEGLT
jgi:hypothetical protein